MKLEIGSYPNSVENVLINRLTRSISNLMDFTLRLYDAVVTRRNLNYVVEVNVSASSRSITLQ